LEALPISHNRKEEAGAVQPPRAEMAEDVEVAVQPQPLLPQPLLLLQQQPGEKADRERLCRVCR
jgi:hypothetical protein